MSGLAEERRKDNNGLAIEYTITYCAKAGRKGRGREKLTIIHGKLTDGGVFQPACQNSVTKLPLTPNSMTEKVHCSNLLNHRIAFSMNPKTIFLSFFSF